MIVTFSQLPFRSLSLRSRCMRDRAKKVPASAAVLHPVVDNLTSPTSTSHCHQISDSAPPFFDDAPPTTQQRRPIISRRRGANAAQQLQLPTVAPWRTVECFESVDQKNTTWSNHSVFLLLHAITITSKEFAAMFQSTTSSMTTASGNQSVFSIASLIGRRCSDHQSNMNPVAVSEYVINDVDKDGCNCRDEERIAMIKLYSGKVDEESPLFGMWYNYSYKWWYLTSSIIRNCCCFLIRGTQLHTRSAQLYIMFTMQRRCYS